MKLISLTKYDGMKVFIRPKSIVSVEEFENNKCEICTLIRYGDTSCQVKESVCYVLAMISGGDK